MSLTYSTFDAIQSLSLSQDISEDLASTVLVKYAVKVLHDDRPNLHNASGHRPFPLGGSMVLFPWVDCDSPSQVHTFSSDDELKIIWTIADPRACPILRTNSGCFQCCH